MQPNEIDQKKLKQVVIDRSLHRLLKVKASRLGRSIRSLVEEGLATVFEVKPTTE